ncbi:hypothetical protein GBF38_006349 [Nibea albiflora]|uniref:Uncharacterized protein n=1 Tax=Nibea albiflora TaxID=240163 RepID=A0ACB7FEM7_NIBAL|nr:hypothetical protein GBF38_006349 [Nibea albiflora]
MVIGMWRFAQCTHPLTAAGEQRRGRALPRSADGDSSDLRRTARPPTDGQTSDGRSDLRRTVRPPTDGQLLEKVPRAQVEFMMGLVYTPR